MRQGEVSNASKDLGVCPWDGGSPGKLSSGRRSIRAALLAQYQRLKEEEATVAAGWGLSW